MQVYRLGIIKVSSRWAWGSINLLIPNLSLRAQKSFTPAEIIVKPAALQTLLNPSNCSYVFLMLC